MNVLNYNEFTRNIEQWDPFLQKIDLSFFLDKNEYYIL